LAESRRIKGTRAGKATAQALCSSDKRYICHEGGARSGKTYGILQVLIWYAWANPKVKITVVSHSLPHLKRGAMRDFMEIVEDWGMYREDWHNKTDNIYHFPNGSWVEFFGLEDAGKARGPGRHVLFVNEANLVSKQVFDQLDVRTTGKVIIDLNPADFDSWCYELADRADSIRVHSTYKDNPYISEAQIRVIESYRDADPNGLMWKVYGLGQRGASEETIYTHWKIGEMPGKGSVWYGLDFGYNVPSALVKVEHYEGAIYVKEVLYKTKLTTGDLVLEMTGLNINAGDEIYCDAAEPKTIEELYRAGFNVMPADKDVTEGIRKVKSMPLYVTADSHNVRRELGGYKWKKDKNDKVLDEPTKENDHACDAIRYAVFTRLKVGEAEFFMI
jgi:phage terminase large subunit